MAGIGDSESGCNLARHTVSGHPLNIHNILCGCVHDGRITEIIYGRTVMISVCPECDARVEKLTYELNLAFEHRKLCRSKEMSDCEYCNDIDQEEYGRGIVPS